ncbi:glycosyltransferase [Flavobacterium sp. 120]|uniref:glycosyltransferase n=1 Tax=Flavobacterium sp. 120 TaxID=2135626 RepID=UPI000EAE8C0A|nr:glycosyltransferase [Flavobacterium sp. 120]RKS13309.1 glycosyltransferase involved in cell wall biosynthesis [Flavobacterium sp. 120]
MKILHIIASANPESGGLIQGIRNYEEALHLLGIQRDLLCFETPSDILEWQFPVSLKVIGLGTSKTGWQYNEKLIPWLKNNIHNYDHVVLDGLWSYHTYATLKVVETLKKENLSAKLPAVFLMPHGMLDPWFQRDKSRRIKAIRNFFYWHLIEKKVLNAVDGLLFTCEEELILARTTFSGYKPKQELNIGFGIVEPPICTKVMLDEFYRQFPISKGKYLLFLSRIHPKKGVDLLLKAYCQIIIESDQPEELPNLIIAGPGIETDYGQELLKYLDANLVLRDKVQFVGHLSGNLKWGAIHGCEAFILPSHQENFGIAVAEALACSKPVLITDKVNIYREIESGLGGIINQDTLAGTTKSILDWLSLSSLEKEKMELNSRLVYEKHFNIANAAKKYFSVMAASK